MKLIKQLIFIPLLLVACLPKVPVKKVCTEEARAGLTVFIKDTRTGIFLSDSLTVIAKDGNYNEELQLFLGNPPSFSGAWERVGNYIITATRRGYNTSNSLPILVSADECHVISQTHTIEITPI